MYCDAGYNFNDANSYFAALFSQNCYKIAAMRCLPYAVKTTCPSHSACRAPATSNVHAMIEAIMEHVAAEVGMDPLDLKMTNLMERGDPVFGFPTSTLAVDNPIGDMIADIAATSDLEARKTAVESFNSVTIRNNFHLAIIAQLLFLRQINGRREACLWFP